MYRSGARDSDKQVLITYEAKLSFRHTLIDVLNTLLIHTAISFLRIFFCMFFV